ncbi:hypothetical protein AB3S75_007708 [Citrus x aurantiifolia]
MDPEELIKRCRAIRLSDEEGGRVSFKNRMKINGEKILAGCLVGKVLHTREVSIEGLNMAMQWVWKTSREVKIEKLGDNVFMFKFGSEVDKRSIMVGGPWHFNRALIALTEPAGIGDIKKQDFSHVSFWVQIHDVPIMCMSKDMVAELGKVIGKVEEVETDAAGECFGQFLRLRISVDITKPLKKIIELEQEKEDADDIPMRVMYERLPDICFCYGRIGHQYRECVYYKSQSKDELAYGPWLEANTIAEKLKQGRGRDRWTAESSRFRSEELASTKPDMGTNREKGVHQKAVEPSSGDDLNQPTLDPGPDSLGIEKGGDQMVVETHLLQNGIRHGELWSNCKEQKSTAKGVAVHREVDVEAGNKGGNKKEREELTQKGKSEMVLCHGLEKTGVFEPEKNEIKGALEDREGQQKINMSLAQMELEIENAENVPKVEKQKLRRKKWKLQARNVEGSGGKMEGSTNLKRPMSSMNWESPRGKKSKIESPQAFEISQRVQRNVAAATKLNFKNEHGKLIGEPQNAAKETSAVAGGQPRRQP